MLFFLAFILGLSSNLSYSGKKVTHGFEAGGQKIAKTAKKAGAKVKNTAIAIKQKVSKKPTYNGNFESQDLCEFATYNWMIKSESSGDDFYLSSPEKRLLIFEIKNQDNPKFNSASSFVLRNLYTFDYIASENLVTESLISPEQENFDVNNLPTFVLNSSDKSKISICSKKDSSEDSLATDWDAVKNGNVNKFWIDQNSKSLINTNDKPTTANTIIQIKSENGHALTFDNLGDKNTLALKPAHDFSSQKVSEESLKQLWVVEFSKAPSIEYSSLSAKTNQDAVNEGKFYSQEWLFGWFLNFIKENIKIYQPILDESTKQITNYFDATIKELEDLFNKNSIDSQAISKALSKTDLLKNDLKYTEKEYATTLVISSLPYIDNFSDEKLIEELKSGQRNKAYPENWEKIIRQKIVDVVKTDFPDLSFASILKNN